METFLLIDVEFKILAQCMCKSITKAEQIFINRGFVIGNAISEADYILDMQSSYL